MLLNLFKFKKNKKTASRNEIVSILGELPMKIIFAVCSVLIIMFFGSRACGSSNEGTENNNKHYHDSSPSNRPYCNNSKKGCCAHHQGVSYCNGENYICKDGTTSNCPCCFND